LVVAHINAFLNYTSFLITLQLTEMAPSGEHSSTADNVSMRGVFQWIHFRHQLSSACRPTWHTTAQCISGLGLVIVIY